MYNDDSARWMAKAQEAAYPFPEDPRKFCPNVVRFFPFNAREDLNCIGGAIFHLLYPNAHCESCRWNYSQHRACMHRGFRLLGMMK